MKPAPERTQRGFTLFELAIVLIVVAMVVGMSMQMGVSMIDTARLSGTQQKMKTINEALMQYRTANDRLPCPGDLTLAPGAANYGLEAGAGAGSSIGTGTGVCTGTGMSPAANNTGAGATNSWETGAEGAVPALSLGLSQDFMLDGWGDKFRYAVDISYTANAAFASAGISCVNGAITVNDVNGNARSTGALYALISHGANGHGAYTQNGTAMVSAQSANANEQTNCHCNSSATATAYAPTYVQAQQSLDPSNSLDSFDDLVSYKERWQMRTDWDKAGGCAYMYVVDGGGERVEYFNLSGKYLAQIGGCSSGACSAGGGNGKLSGPDTPAIDSSGNIWVVGDASNWAEKFNSSGSYVSGFTGNGQFNTPQAVAIDSSGNLWVVDGGNNRVEEFNTSGTWLASLGGTSSACTSCLCTGPSSSCPSTSGSGNGQFNNPSGVAITPSGNFWVVDKGNNRVEEFSSSGSFLMGIGAGYNGVSGSIGASGTGHGQFNTPTGIAIDGSGNLWVEDTQNFRVQEFNSSGTVLTGIGAGYNGVGIGSYGCGNGQLYEPLQIAFDSSGNLWVADYGCTRVEEFSSTGTYLSQFGGTWGPGNGQFQGLVGIAIGNR